MSTSTMTATPTHPDEARQRAEEELELSTLNNAKGKMSGIATGEDPAPSIPTGSENTLPTVTVREESAADLIMEQSRQYDALVPDGGWESWAMVACCSMLAFWYVGTTYSWGVLQAALVDADLAPASTLAFVGSLAVAMLSALAMLNSRLLPLVGARSMAIAGVILMSLGQILAGFATHSVAALFVTAGVMMGVGVSFCFMVISITPAQYFSKKRGTAIGIVYAGGGLGGAVISLALEAAVKRLGVPWTFRLVGLVMLACCLPAAWFIHERTSFPKAGFIDW